MFVFVASILFSGSLLNGYFSVAIELCILIYFSNIILFNTSYLIVNYLEMSNEYL